MLRTLLSIILAACLGSMPAAAKTLVTWNLEWATLRAGAPPNAPALTPQRLQQLRAYAERIDADLFALQEIGEEATAQAILDPARWQVVLADQQDLQRVGLAIRRGIAWRRHADLVALGAGHLRRGLDVTVMLDGAPVRILVVHLKSGCQRQPTTDGTPACESLSRQVPVLAHWIEARRSAGERFMVVGDFNRTYQSGDPFWGAFTGMAIPTANHQPACNGGRYAEHIDHVAASPGILLGPVVEVTYDGTPTPSDHCPLVVKVGKGHE